MFASDAAAVPRLVARLAELEQEEADAVRIRDYATAERIQLEYEEVTEELRTIEDAIAETQSQIPRASADRGAAESPTASTPS